MEIVGEEVPWTLLEKNIRELNPDIVICSDKAAGFGDRADRFIWKYPTVKFVVLANQGRTAFLYKLAPVKVSLGEMSPENLVQALRSAETV